MRVFLCLSYVAQFIPLAGSVLPAEQAELAAILHLPASLLPLRLAARLQEFGGPRIPDLHTHTAAARLRVAHRTVAGAAALLVQPD